MNNAAKLIIGIVGSFFALVLALLLVLILAGGGVFGMGQMMNGYGSGPGQMMNGFGSWWMIVPLLFVWGGVITLIVWAITKIFSNDQPGSDDLPQDKAEDVLRERFARGEVDAEEYGRSLEVLRDENQRTKGSNLR